MWPTSDRARIEDTWSVVGMRGTGSQDFVVDDIFVPDAHTCFLGEPAVETGPLYNSRLVLVTLFTAVVANSLGVARGAIDAFIEFGYARKLDLLEGYSARSPLRAGAPRRGRGNSQFRPRLRHRCGRNLMGRGLRWGRGPERRHCPGRLAIVHAMHAAVRAVDLVFHAAGTNAIYTRNPLERYFRDIHVAVQHNTAFPAQYEIRWQRC